MSCEAFTTGADMLLSDQSLEALWCVYQTSVGSEFTVGGVGGAVAASYYVHGRSWVVPVVLVIILSSVVAPQVPAGALSLAAFMLVFGFAAFIMFLIHRSRDDV
jgi:hypothetical protein